jgi:hypothetical protein
MAENKLFQPCDTCKFTEQIKVLSFQINHGVAALRQDVDHFAPKALETAQYAGDCNPVAQYAAKVACVAALTSEIDQIAQSTNALDCDKLPEIDCPRARSIMQQAGAALDRATEGKS